MHFIIVESIQSDLFIYFYTEHATVYSTKGYIAQNCVYSYFTVASLKAFSMHKQLSMYGSDLEFI